MNKRFIFILVAVIVILVALIAWMTVQYILQRNGSPSESEYSAVYLTSGDVYFGKLSWFPWPRLREVWYLQRGVSEQNQPQLGIAQLKNAFWGPMDVIYLNPKQILFWTRLRSDSQLTKAFANPSAMPPVQQQSQTQPNSQPANTSK